MATEPTKAQLEYRSERLVVRFDDEKPVREYVDRALADWVTGGWTLHSQSIAPWIGGGNGYATASIGEIVLLVFQREIDPTSDG